jgi:hypothetical protein
MPVVRKSHIEGIVLCCLALFLAVAVAAVSEGQLIAARSSNTTPVVYVKAGFWCVSKAPPLVTLS